MDVIDYYRQNGSPVYRCCLDASKAFDHAPHQCLINVRVTFANNHGLIHNEEKTNFVCFKPDVLKNIYVPNVEINGKTRELVREKNSFVSLSMIVFMMMTIYKQ